MKDENIKRSNKRGNDELRESIHFELAPCTNEEFIITYCNADPTFEDLLNEEFHIEL